MPFGNLFFGRFRFGCGHVAITTETQAAFFRHLTCQLFQLGHVDRIGI